MTSVSFVLRQLRPVHFLSAIFPVAPHSRIPPQRSPILPADPPIENAAHGRTWLKPPWPAQAYTTCRPQKRRSQPCCHLTSTDRPRSPPSTGILWNETGRFRWRTAKSPGLAITLTSSVVRASLATATHMDTRTAAPVHTLTHTHTALWGQELISMRKRRRKRRRKSRFGNPAAGGLRAKRKCPMARTACRSCTDRWSRPVSRL